MAQAQRSTAKTSSRKMASIIDFSSFRSLKEGDRLADIEVLTARLAVLADRARDLGDEQLEGLLLHTSAEFLASAKEIAGSDYAAALIARLTDSTDRIEQELAAGPADRRR